jgi:hypothetical protein
MAKLLILSCIIFTTFPWFQSINRIHFRMQKFMIKTLLKLHLQWTSEYQTGLEFKWSKLVLLSNGLVFRHPLNSKLKSPGFKWSNHWKNECQKFGTLIFLVLGFLVYTSNRVWINSKDWPLVMTWSPEWGTWMIPKLVC